MAPITLPAGKYIIIFECYRNGSINLGYSLIRVGTSANAGCNNYSENSNSKVQYILLQSFDTESTVKATAYIDASKLMGKNVSYAVSTKAIRIK